MSAVLRRVRAYTQQQLRVGGGGSLWLVSPLEVRAPLTAGRACRSYAALMLIFEYISARCDLNALEGA